MRASSFPCGRSLGLRQSGRRFGPPAEACDHARRTVSGHMAVHLGPLPVEQRLRVAWGDLGDGVRPGRCVSGFEAVGEDLFLSVGQVELELLVDILVGEVDHCPIVITDSNSG